MAAVPPAAIALYFTLIAAAYFGLQYRAWRAGGLATVRRPPMSGRR